MVSWNFLGGGGGGGVQNKKPSVGEHGFLLELHTAGAWVHCQFVDWYENNNNNNTSCIHKI